MGVLAHDDDFCPVCRRARRARRAARVRTLGIYAAIIGSILLVMATNALADSIR